MPSMWRRAVRYFSKLVAIKCQTHIEKEKLTLCKFCKLTEEQKKFVEIFIEKQR